jgi:hypothetical protein
MRLENIVFNIEDDRISCENDISPLNSKTWAIDLLPDKIVYSTKRKTTEFAVNDIQELQYEADTFGKYDLQDSAAAYVILKDNPEPQYFFSIVVNQHQFALMSKTNASIVCDQILSFIGNKYGIPCNYKISIDTKRKQNNMGLVIAVMIIIPLLMWLMHKYNL